MFSVQGVEAVKAVMDQLQKQLLEIQKGVNTVGPIVTNILAAVRSQLEGFVRAGVGASTAGFVFRFQLERIAREVASLFLPAIKQVVEYTKQLADWLTKLTGAQQQNIARWVAAGAAMLTVSLVLPKVIAGVTALVAGIRALTVAVVGLEGSTGIGALLPVLGGLATALVAVAVGAEVGRKGLGQLWQSVKPLVEGIGKIIGQAFKALEPAFVQFSRAFEAVSSIIISLMPTVSAYAKSVGQAVVALLKVLAELGTLLVNTLGRGVAAVAGAFATVLTPVLKALAVLLEGVGFVLTMVGDLLAWIGSTAAAAFEPVRVALAPLADALGELWQALLDVGDALDEALAGLGEALAPLLSELGRLLAELVKGLLLPFIDGLTRLAKFINDVLVPAVKLLVGWLKQLTQLLGTMKKTEMPEVGGPHQRLNLQPVGFEAVESTWQRIAAASVKASLGGKTKEEEQLEALKGIESNTKATAEGVGRIKPAVA